MNAAVILPSLNPDEKMVNTVHGLVEEGFRDIIVVDDGSDEAHRKYFDRVRNLPAVTVLTHEVNRGKGRAMKTAFSYLLDRESGKVTGEDGAWNRITGVVTVDGDGQHLPKDIRACVEAMEAEQGVDPHVRESSVKSSGDRKSFSGKKREPGPCIILGVRDFSGAGIPAKSRMGNNITKAVFRYACGIRVSDTQTGLRAIPFTYLPLMSEIEGERYEYETNQLLEIKRHHIPMKEVKIETVYIDDNSSSHFHPFRDTVRIYKVIFKYIASSLGSFLVDMALFTVINLLLESRVDDGTRLFAATAGARVVSSLVNFSLNRNVVFRSDEPVSRSMVRYYILCVCQAALSYGGVYLLAEVLLGLGGGPVESLVKLAVDVCLFLISYRIQRVWVFRQE